MKEEMTSRRVSVSTMVTIFWSDGLRTHFKINFSNIKYLANKFFLKAFLALSINRFKLFLAINSTTSAFILKKIAYLYT